MKIVFYDFICEFKEVIMIQQQPKVSANDQPTIAIITVNYYEKLAVDAMMTDKVTFVRHKPEGKIILFLYQYEFEVR